MNGGWRGAQEKTVSSIVKLLSAMQPHWRDYKSINALSLCTYGAITTLLLY